MFSSPLHPDAHTNTGRLYFLYSPLAEQRIKQVALSGLDLPLEQGLRLEAEGFQWLIKTEDAREGARAFAEKRDPSWAGK